jgi:ABC-type phosphate transport system substrate-binding protein
MPGGAGLGERKHNTVSGITTLLLVVTSQACGGSQEYVDSPDAMQVELSHELSLGSELPIARRPGSQTSLSSSIRASATLVRIGGVVGDRNSLIERVREGFESSHPAVKIRIFDPKSDQALEEMVRGKLDLILTTKPLSYAQKRKGLRQETLTVKTWVPIVNAKNPLFDLTQDQFSQILGGTTHHWSSLGRLSADVQRVILDQEDMGQWEAWQALFPKAGLEPRGSAQATWLQVVDRVSQDRGAIALVPLEAAQSAAIKVLAVNGNRATYQNLKQGSYPLSYVVYVTYSVECPPEALELKDLLIRHEANGLARARPGR